MTLHRRFGKQRKSSGIPVSKSLKRLYIIFGVVIASTLLGTSGYIFIEDFSPVEAFYQAVITLSTVGFEEVHQLSPKGMVFTSIYIILNLGIFAYVISATTTYLFEGELNRIFRFYLTKRQMKKLSEHVIVCGLGRNGRRAVEELASNGKDFVIVEIDQEVLAWIEGISNSRVVVGDATLDDTLLRAGVD